MSSCNATNENPEFDAALRYLLSATRLTPVTILFAPLLVTFLHRSYRADTVWGFFHGAKDTVSTLDDDEHEALLKELERRVSAA